MLATAIIDTWLSTTMNRANFRLAGYINDPGFAFNASKGYLLSCHLLSRVFLTGIPGDSPRVVLSGSSAELSSSPYTANVINAGPVESAEIHISTSFPDCQPNVISVAEPAMGEHSISGTLAHRLQCGDQTCRFKSIIHSSYVLLLRNPAPS